MSWHTSLIFIQQPVPGDFASLLERLGFPGCEPAGIVSFEDATSMLTPGKSVAHVNGWTVVCDSTLFASADSFRQTADQVWSPRLDRTLRELSASGATVFGFITEGSSGIHGFTLYRGGNRVRIWLERGGSVVADEGIPLPEEEKCFGQDSPFDREQGLLKLSGRLCVPLDVLDGAVFNLFVEPARAGRTFVEQIAELSRLPASAAVPVLAKLLESDDENARGYAAAALGDFGAASESAIPALLGLLRDEGKCRVQDKPRSYPVRFRAAFALAKIAPEREEIIPVVREAMHYRKLDHAQAEAFETIRLLGARGWVFVPELKGMENVSDRVRRARVQMTLAALDSDYQVTDPVAQSALAAVKRLEAEKS